MLNAESFLLGMVAGGGGNPNYVETITGTLANPFGDLDVAELYSELASNAATVILSSLNVPLFGQITGLNSVLFGTVIFSEHSDEFHWLGCSVSYNLSDETPHLGYAKTLHSNVWTDIPQATQTTLTIIHHPLP